jgi:hypothetical protein
MKIVVQLESPVHEVPHATYTWDADTEILSAQFEPRVGGTGMTGSVGLEGGDGSWVILDVAGGQITGVEVAVWPEVRELDGLAAPAADDSRAVLPSRRSQPSLAALEMDTLLVAESRPARDIFHFRLGRSRPARTVRVAHELLLDIDPEGHIAGLWLLNVPPSPCPSPTASASDP